MIKYVVAAALAFAALSANVKVSVGENHAAACDDPSRCDPTDPE